MRGFLTFLTVLVLIVALALGGLYYFLTAPAPTLVAATAVPTSVAAAASFDNKVSTITGAAKNTPVTIELTNEELTSKFAQQVQQYQASYGADIQNPQVSARDGHVYAGGKAKTNNLPVRVDLVVVTVPEARDGKLHLRVERVESGRIPLPDSLKSQIVNTVQDDATLNDNLPITVDAVEVLNGKLRLTGRPK